MENQTIILIAIAVFIFVYKFKPRLLCKVGFHRWTKPRLFSNFSSGVKDYSKHCKLCGNKKRWSVARKRNWDDY